MHIRVAVVTTISTLAALGAALDYHSRDGYGTGKAISITKNFSLVNADTSVDFDALKLHVASVRAYVICAPTLRLLSTCFLSSKILHGLDNYQNNTGTAYPYAVGGTRKRVAGNSLTDYKDMLWYGNILVGTPPKMFNGMLFRPLPINDLDSLSMTVCFDTGSRYVVFVPPMSLFHSIRCSDLFVPAVNCDSSCDGHQLWDPTSSSTAKDLDLQFSLQYGDGSTVSGEQYRDTVSISGFTVCLVYPTS